MERKVFLEEESGGQDDSAIGFAFLEFRNVSPEMKIWIQH
jgi:hypothetical protein